MAEGGCDVHDNPWLDENLDTHDSDDEHEINTTRPFQPRSSSTPYHGGEEHPMQTFSHEKDGLLGASYDQVIFGDIPPLEGFLHEDDKRLCSIEQENS